MRRIFLIQQHVISRLKQRARCMKREKIIPHHEALELTAQAVGFDNWKQVIDAAAVCRPTEEAFRRGFFLAYDPSEVPDMTREDFPFLWERDAFYLLKEELFKCYASQPDEEDPDERPMSETVDLEEHKEYFEADWENMYYFRLKTPSQVRSIEQLLKLVSEECFWLPRYVFVKGELIDASIVPVSSSDDCVVRIRLDSAHSKDL